MGARSAILMGARSAILMGARSAILMGAVYAILTGARSALLMGAVSAILMSATLARFAVCNGAATTRAFGPAAAVYLMLCQLPRRPILLNVADVSLQARNKLKRSDVDSVIKSEE